jgi:hypothetical protein
MKIATNTAAADTVHQLEKRWTRALIAPGWTALPSVILERQQALGLDAIDVNILMQLARYWWKRDNPPHPSKATIAACLGVDGSTVRRGIARMERDGLIRRVARYDAASRRQENNAYVFDGLIKEATPYAAEALAEKERRRAKAAARIRRKRPVISIVSLKG